MKSIWFVIGVFLFFGVLWSAIAAFYITKQVYFINTAQRTNGEIINNVEERDSKNNILYHPVYRYKTIEGQVLEHRAENGSNPPSYQIGQSVKVLYKNDTVYIDSFVDLWFKEALFLLFALIFGGVGVGILLHQLKRRRDITWLKNNGTTIQSNLLGVEQNTSVSVNNEYPYQVMTQWLNPKDNRVYKFKSEYIWYDPTSYLNQQLINVVIDPKNPKRFYMDTSFLPKAH